MLYQKIRVTCKDCPKRFYRVMYVRKDLNLKQLGYVILKSLRSEFEHAYLFEDATQKYDPKEWIEMTPWGSDNKDMEKFTLAQLTLKSGNKFIMEYDTGEGWQFAITVYPDEKEIEGENYGINTEAKGDRIWEDNRYLFSEFLSGDEIEDAPWNIPEDAEPKDFDNPINLDELNDETETYDEEYEEFFADVEN